MSPGARGSTSTLGRSVLSSCCAASREISRSGAVPFALRHPGHVTTRRGGGLLQDRSHRPAFVPLTTCTTVAAVNAPTVAACPTPAPPVSPRTGIAQRTNGPRAEAQEPFVCAVEFVRRQQQRWCRNSILTYAVVSRSDLYVSIELSVKTKSAKLCQGGRLGHLQDPCIGKPRSSLLGALMRREGHS